VIQGDTVTKGETLAVLDTADLTASLNAAIQTASSNDAHYDEAKYQEQLNLGTGNDQVTSAKAALVQAQVTLKEANLDLSRYEALLSSGYVSQQQVDQQRTLVHNDVQAEQSAQAQLSTAITNQRVNGSYKAGLQAATVAAALADAQSSHAQADQIRAQIARATVTSPVDGVITNRNLNPGEYPGSRTIFTVQQLDPVYAELNASSEDVFRIQHNAPVSVGVAGISTNAYPGKVSAVLGQVTPGSTNFTVECILANPGLKLKSGMAVTGTVSLPTSTGIGIPTAAFLDDSHTSVLIVGSDNKAATQNVKEVTSDGTTSIVTGVASGTKVISNGQLGITAGEQVTAQ
jgi:multidrug resistance efflux pump